ncbi:hypothetical protein GCM10008956_15050 [Deinococcus arenae]|uniref:Uncharacterized protein n=1 Tax=Deinococcus arenae TaxID=1452751 RepID=A0A8H9L650_9DEIO|nr:hypothetical protein GCM10008956_15050 [Deinococcus arenae]
MTGHTPQQEKHPSPDAKNSISIRLWLRHTRKARRLSQEHISTYTAQFGPDSTISRTLLSHVECGRTKLTSLGPQRLEALRQALGVPADEWRTQVGE